MSIKSLIWLGIALVTISLIMALFAAGLYCLERERVKKVSYPIGWEKVKSGQSIEAYRVTKDSVYLRFKDCK